MLDPAILHSIRIAFAVLLAVAALHKLTGQDTFRDVLLDYRLLPAAIVSLLAWVIPLVELSLAAGWLLSQDLTFVATMTGSLLLVYTLAVAINLLRGRAHIGCGCGLPGSALGDQPLSYGVVGRNVALIALALSAILPSSARVLTVFDYVVVAALLLTSGLLYAAANQLMNNGAAIGSWRHQHD